MESTGAIDSSAGGPKQVEEFNLSVKDKRVKAAALFKLDSLFAAWLYRIAVLAVLGWNGNSLNSLADRIADRVTEKLAVVKAAAPDKPASLPVLDQPLIKPKPARRHGKKL